MKRTTALKTLQILLIIVMGCLLAIIHYPRFSFKEYALQMLVVACSICVGYIDRMIDEEKEK